MLIALFYLFFPSSAIDMQVMDISKPVKQYMLDEAKVKQIVAINKEMLKQEAAFQKDTAKSKKQLAKLNGNRLASVAEFDEVFSTLDQMRTDARDKIVDNRFKMRELMTAEEWGNVYSTTGSKK